MAGYLLFLLQQSGKKGLVKGPVQVMNHQDVLLKSASIQHNQHYFLLRLSGARMSPGYLSCLQSSTN